MKTARIPAAAFFLIGTILMETCHAQANAQECELDELKKRISELEHTVNRQQQLLDAQQLRSAPPLSRYPQQQVSFTSPRENDLSGYSVTQIVERLSLSGTLETEASYSRTKSDTTDAETSDITLATLELGIEANLTDWLKGTAIFLWEEDDTEPIDLDVATVCLGNPDHFPFSLEVGKFYVPFGKYDSVFITDPVTLELGETRESAARLSLLQGPLQVGISVFNGDIDETGSTDNHLENIVLDASLEREWDQGSLVVGISYTTNLADSDGLQDAVLDNTRGGTLDNRIEALSVWMNMNCRRVSLSFEYLAALDDFASGSLSFDGPGNDWDEESRPCAMNVELQYQLTDRFMLAAKFEQASDTFDWQPEQRYGGVAQYILHASDYGTASFGVEYLHGTYDDVDDTREDTVTFQLALEF